MNEDTVHNLINSGDPPTHLCRGTHPIKPRPRIGRVTIQSLGQVHTAGGRVTVPAHTLTGELPSLHVYTSILIKLLIVIKTIKIIIDIGEYVQISMI